MRNDITPTPPDVELELTKALRKELADVEGLVVDREYRPAHDNDRYVVIVRQDTGQPRGLHLFEFQVGIRVIGDEQEGHTYELGYIARRISAAINNCWLWGSPFAACAYQSLPMRVSSTSGERPEVYQTASVRLVATPNTDR